MSLGFCPCLMEFTVANRFSLTLTILMFPSLYQMNMQKEINKGCFHSMLEGCPF